MENIKIKNYYNKMSEDAKIILVNILADNLIYLHDFEVVDKEVVKSISSLLLLFINYNTLNTYLCQLYDLQIVSLYFYALCTKSV